jgi:hypothetical protein
MPFRSTPTTAGKARPPLKNNALGERNPAFGNFADPPKP